MKTKNLDRRHKCEICQRLFICERCSNAMLQSVCRMRKGNRDDVALYAAKYNVSNRLQQTPVFVCPSCIRRKKKTA